MNQYRNITNTILVTVWNPGKPTELVQIARRPDAGGTWGPPITLFPIDPNTGEITPQERN